MHGCGPFSIEPTLGTPADTAGLPAGTGAPGAEITVHCGAEGAEQTDEVTTCACGEGAGTCSWSSVCVVEEESGFVAFANGYHSFMKNTVVHNLSPENEQMMDADGGWLGPYVLLFLTLLFIIFSCYIYCAPPLRPQSKNTPPVPGRFLFASLATKGRPF